MNIDKQKLFNTYETIRVMLFVRGYTQPDSVQSINGCEWMNKPTKEERFAAYSLWAEEKSINNIKDSLKLKATTTPKSPETTTLVVWMCEEKLGENIQNVVYWMGDDCKKAIVIIAKDITPKSKQIVACLAKEGKYVDWFMIDDITSVLLEHKLVPKHRVCSKAEKKALLKHYDITINEVPEIKKTDPVIKFMIGSSAKKGTLIHITRESLSFEGCEEYNYRKIS